MPLFCTTLLAVLPVSVLDSPSTHPLIGPMLWMVVVVVVV